MAEALENLQAVHEAHKKEMTQLQTVANEHSKLHSFSPIVNSLWK